METNKNSKAGMCCTSHRSEILGIIFLAIATILTILTFNGMGIFGMFLVGSIFCCHKHWGRRCSCGCKCCSEPTMTTCTETEPVIHNKKQTVAVKKAVTKKQ